MSTPTVLPASALAQLASTTAPYATRFRRPALARAGLYVTPVPLAVAASEPLARVPWPVLAGAAAIGWCALWVLSQLGRVVAGRAGPGAAARLVLVGFGAVAVAWSGLLAVAWPALLALAPLAGAGADRGAAYAVSLPVLVLLAGFAAGLATGTEAALLRWSAPALLVAGATIAGWLPAPGWPVGAEPLLLAAVGVLAVRGFAPALRRRDRRTWPVRLGSAELRRYATYALLGLSQVAAVGLVWRVGQATAPPGALPPTVVPLLLAVPLMEIWVGWHRARVAAGLARYDDREPHQRYVRRLGWATLAGLLPPLVTGAALAGAAHRLPYGLSAHPDAPPLVLALAGGVLLAGTVAVGWLLAARDRPGLAAAVTGGPVVGALALAGAVPGLAARSLTGPGQLLPATVIALAVAYAAGLVVAAYVLVDARSVR